MEAAIGADEVQRRQKELQTMQRPTAKQTGAKGQTEEEERLHRGGRGLGESVVDTADGPMLARRALRGSEP